MLNRNCHCCWWMRNYDSGGRSKPWCIINVAPTSFYRNWNCHGDSLNHSLDNRWALNHGLGVVMNLPYVRVPPNYCRCPGFHNNTSASTDDGVDMRVSN